MPLIKPGDVVRNVAGVLGRYYVVVDVLPTIGKAIVRPLGEPDAKAMTTLLNRLVITGADSRKGTL